MTGSSKFQNRNIKLQLEDPVLDEWLLMLVEDFAKLLQREERAHYAHSDRKLKKKKTPPKLVRKPKFPFP